MSNDFTLIESRNYSISVIFIALSLIIIPLYILSINEPDDSKPTLDFEDTYSTIEDFKTDCKNNKGVTKYKSYDNRLDVRYLHCVGG